MLGSLSEIGYQADKLNKEDAMNFVIIIEQDEEGVFVVECPSIVGCISQGKTDKKP